MRASGVGLAALGAAAAITLPLVNDPAPAGGTALPRVPAATAEPVTVAQHPPGPRPLPEPEAALGPAPVVEPEPVPVRVVPLPPAAPAPALPVAHGADPRPAAPADKRRGRAERPSGDGIGLPASIERPRDDWSRERARHTHE